jgi:DNA end-binding protein Ku
MRSIWSGAISFGLINIPVKLYTAVRDTRPDFDLLHRRDLSPIRYARVCAAEGEEVPYEEIVKGYEFRKGDYVVLEDEDLQRANVRKTQTIDISDFVDAGEIDPKLFEKPYYLEPGKAARKAYALLREGLKKTKKVGLARFVLRSRERLAILRPEGNLVVLEQLRFPDEIVAPTDLDVPGEAEASGRELDIAVKLIDQLTNPFHAEQYHDTYTEELMRVIREKAEGKEPAPVGALPVPTEVPDLMAKLRQSLAEAKKRKAAAA